VEYHPKNRFSIRLIEDYLLGGILFLLSLPLFLSIAFISKVVQGGPVLFRQKRRGFAEQYFHIIKFRTISSKQADTQTVPSTSTKWGRFLRYTSLDELPQFINVMKGEMSLVGPRPHEETEDAYFRANISGYEERFLVKPGITGWAQVNGWRGENADPAHLRQRVDHDIGYIRHWSLRLDMKIILLTPAAMCRTAR